MLFYYCYFFISWIQQSKCIDNCQWGWLSWSSAITYSRTWKYIIWWGWRLIQCNPRTEWIQAWHCIAVWRPSVLCGSYFPKLQFWVCAPNFGESACAIWKLWVSTTRYFSPSKLCGELSNLASHFMRPSYIVTAYIIKQLSNLSFPKPCSLMRTSLFFLMSGLLVFLHSLC